MYLLQLQGIADTHKNERDHAYFVNDNEDRRLKGFLQILFPYVIVCLGCLILLACLSS